jgi:hypothetical protein
MISTRNLSLLEIDLLKGHLQYSNSGSHKMNYSSELDVWAHWLSNSFSKGESQ